MLEISRLKSLPNKIRGEFTRKIVSVGADVLKSAAQSAAGSIPSSTRSSSKWIHTKGSIIIYERKRKESYLQSESDMNISLLVGPSKKAPQTFWRERGRRAFSIKAKNKKALHWSGGGGNYFAKSASIGTQPARPTIGPAMESAMPRAWEAMKKTAQTLFSNFQGS
jgi:hypothetical protein